MMKGNRGHPNRRRSALGYLVLMAPLVMLAYTISRKDTVALSSVLQGEAIKDAAAPLVVLLRDEEDAVDPSTYRNEAIIEAALKEAALKDQFSFSPALNNGLFDGIGFEGEDDYDRQEIEAALAQTEEPEESAYVKEEETWSGTEEGADIPDGLGTDPTSHAAFNGEGLDAGDEDGTVLEPGDDLTLEVSGNTRHTPPPSPVLPDMVFGKMQDEDVNEVLRWMRKCTSLGCVIKAHDRLQGRTKFNFPHYFLIGWQKCATTSVNAYLRFHPQYLPGIKKEPHWFSVCQSNLNAPHCLVKNESQYLREFLRLEEAVASRLGLVTVDASADYAGRGGPLARRLYRLFPWLKIVIMIREPISRIISYTRMHTQSTFQEWKACNPGSSLFTCLRPHLTPGASNSNYSDALLGWLSTFPSDQIHVIQFEELQEAPDKVLYDLKSFLGMDVDLPDRPISNVNTRKEGKGYPMGRGQYLRLVRMVKQDAERTADMLDRYGLADKTAWMARWHGVWNDFLTRCPTFEEECRIDSN